MLSPDIPSCMNNISSTKSHPNKGRRYKTNGPFDKELVFLQCPDAGKPEVLEGHPNLPPEVTLSGVEIHHSVTETLGRHGEESRNAAFLTILTKGERNEIHNLVSAIQHFHFSLGIYLTS